MHGRDEDQKWPRAKFSYSVREACYRDRDIAKREDRKPVTLSEVIKALHPRSRTTFYDDVSACRARSAAGLEDATLPMGSYWQFVKFGRLLNQFEKKAAIEAGQPGERDGVVKKFSADLAKVAQNYSVNLGIAHDLAELKKRYGMVRGAGSESTTKEIRLEVDAFDMLPPDFSAEISRRYEGNSFPGISVGVVKATLDSVTPQAVSAALVHPTLHKKAAERARPGRDIWLHLTSKAAVTEKGASE